MKATDLQRCAAKHLPEAVEFLKQLVSVNSFTANSTGVDTVVDLTVAAFQPLGFQATRVPCATPGTGHHLFLSRKGRGDAPVILVTHSDTVFPAEEEIRNAFAWEESPEEGLIYGPGTVDNKGGTALIWLILKILSETEPDFFERTDWLVAANAAEEIIGDDFGIATAEQCGGNARAVLVFEGGPVDEAGWHLVTSRKGRSTWTLSASGRAAHAGSRHSDGINAIDALVEVLPEIAARTEEDGSLTVNIGRIEGGTVVNRVPHEAFAEWECRAETPASLKEADAFFSALNGKAANGADLISTRAGYTSPWPGNPESEDLYRLWEAAAAGAGYKTVSVPRGGLSDANHLWQLGPTLDGLGPFGGNAHCSERSADGSKVPEFVSVESFVPKAVINALGLLVMD
jgi:glutamate carboxypeptidase